MRSRVSAYALLGLLSVPAVDLGVGSLLAGSAAAIELDMASGATSWGATMVAFERVVGTGHADTISGTVRTTLSTPGTATTP